MGGGGGREVGRRLEVAGIRSNPIFTILTFYLILLFNKSILLPVNVCKNAG